MRTITDARRRERRTDVERLTERIGSVVINVKYATQHETAIHRLAAIEDILGDEYDMDRLRELVEADRDGRCHIGRCVECAHYEGLAVCEFLGDCGGTNWICGWFEPRKAAEDALKGEQNGD